MVGTKLYAVPLYNDSQSNISNYPVEVFGTMSPIVIALVNTGRLVCLERR